MLKFIGSGSAFNTKLGNNSAYHKENNQLLLIDCGSNIFHRIKESNLLDGVEHVHVLITHTHADHVGSLADLILFTYYTHGEFAKPKVTVYSVEDIKLDEVLKLNGCVLGNHYDSNIIEEFDDIDLNGFNDMSFFFFEQKHVDEIKSYGVDIRKGSDYIHYSSDSSKVNLATLDFIQGDYSYTHFYIDTCKADYEGNVHLSLRKLAELVKPDHRNRVWCMHLDEKFVREEAESLGFNVVKNEY